MMPAIVTNMPKPVFMVIFSLKKNNPAAEFTTTLTIKQHWMIPKLIFAS